MEEGSPEDIRTAEDFGRAFTALRKSTRLSVRALSRRTGVPHSTIGDYSSGRHLPSPAATGTLHTLLAACGVTDETTIGQWTDAAVRARVPPGRRPTSVPLPYRGLASFRTEDARWFRGREAATGDLLDRLTGRERADRPLMLVGASGSGKSSLLHAGLLPALPHLVVSCTPGDRPLSRLAQQIAAVTGRPPVEVSTLREWPRALLDEVGELGEAGLCVVVDQLEEVFTLCADEAERRTFITVLQELSGAPTRNGGRVLTVLALRADFYAQALRYRVLAAALDSDQVVVRPMTEDELRRAITEPAREASLMVDEALVTVLAKDLAPGAADADAAHDPGALPLLSHALLATWEIARGNRLTVADYLASGGIRHAIGNSAEVVFDGLTADQKTIARRLFMRLIHLGKDTVDTRRRVRRSELAGSDGVLPPDLEQVLASYVGHRLLTVDSESVEITHEALLAGWPRLRQWLAADREGLLLHRRLTHAAEAWRDAERDPAVLARGGRLALLRDWAADAAHDAALSPLERLFLDASAVQEREEELAARKGVRRLRWLSTALAAVLVFALAVSGVLYRQQLRETAQREQADSREAAARGELLRGQDVSLAAGLGLSAYHLSPTAEARNLLLELSDSPMATRLTGARGVVQAVPVSGRHTLASVAADGSVRLWDITDPAHSRALARFEGPGHSAFYAAAFSPDGTVLAVAGADGVVRLWDVSDARHPVARPVAPGPSHGTVYALGFSPDGDTLAAADASGTVRLWRAGTDGTPSPYRELTGSAAAVQSLAFAPGGREIAAGAADGSVRLWHTGAKNGRPYWTQPVSTQPTTVFSVAFSPDGGRLAAGSRDGTVRLWKISAAGTPAAAALPTPPRSSTWVNAVAFSPDGDDLAVGGSDYSIRLWDITRGRIDAVLPHPGPVAALTWDGPDTLVSGAGDGAARLWRLPVPRLPGAGVVNSIAYRRDGKAIAVASGDVQLWDTARRSRIGPALTGPTAANAVALSPDGRTLAAGYNEGSVRLWDVSDPAAPVALESPLRGSAQGEVESLAFRGDGRVLAAGGDDRTVRLWDVRPGRDARPLAVLRGPANYVFSVAFSPDGHTLAAGSTDKTVRLWDVTRPGRAVPLGKPLTGASDTIYSVAFSPDGHTLAAGSADRETTLWDIRTPTAPRRLGKPLVGPVSYVYSVAFSPNGHTLAVASTDNSVWLWDVRDPTAPVWRTTLTNATDHVYSVAFSPDGRTLAAGSADGYVHVWTLSPEREAARLCSDGSAALTAAEWRRNGVPRSRYLAPCP
ncbi:helix-turn-helix domain-containing protein [Streptomyces pseudovenezuelae]|uniref:nSTAND1 domain-containing NTPase n=1 Tax=Streptomyces pseudovenezuelae TaxID=67350 RepID=UPI0034A476E7